jgi:predicted transcriptional regulator
MSTIEIASKLRISQPAVSLSSKRGEQIENEQRFELIPQKV